jgi:hypothetical protein
VGALRRYYSMSCQWPCADKSITSGWIRPLSSFPASVHELPGRDCLKKARNAAESLIVGSPPAKNRPSLATLSVHGALF